MVTPMTDEERQRAKERSMANKERSDEMPDISMCDSETCPLKAKCYRNPASGTKPSEYRQAWFMGLTEWGEDCKYYWPVEDRK